MEKSRGTPLVISELPRPKLTGCDCDWGFFAGSIRPLTTGGLVDVPARCES